MISAVGDCAAQTASSVRAGINRFEATSIHDRRFEPFVMALVPEECLPPLVEDLDGSTRLTSRQARMLRLATPALREAVEGLPKTEKVPVLVGTPESLPGRPDPAGKRFLEHLSSQSGVPFDIGSSKTFTSGRASIFHAVKKAGQLLKTGRYPYVAVGGVDTYLDLYLLGTLDSENRILAEGVMDGFVPGEGACFLLLGNSTRSSAEKAPVGRIMGTAVGFEKGHRYSKEPYLGEGVSEAIDSLYAEIEDPGKIKSVYAGFNGESHGAKEWGVAVLRHRDRLDEEFEICHPADCFGDTGAASGALMAGCAALRLTDGSQEAPCLVWSSSDYGDTGAALLRKA